MNQNTTNYKIILLGESSVGKTSILTRFTQNKFDELTTSTVKECYTEKEIEVKGDLMRLQIWDTAGQERYRSIVKTYFNGCTAAILVYDITNKESFEKIDSFWYKEIMNNAPNIKLGLAANKFDLFKQEQITENEGKKYAEKIGAIFSTTSAKESMGIDTLFTQIGEKIYELNNQTATFDETMIKTKISYGSGKGNKSCCMSK